MYIPYTLYDWRIVLTLICCPSTMLKVHTAWCMLYAMVPNDNTRMMIIIHTANAAIFIILTLRRHDPTVSVDLHKPSGRLRCWADLYGNAGVLLRISRPGTVVVAAMVVPLISSVSGVLYWAKNIDYRRHRMYRHCAIYTYICITLPVAQLILIWGRICPCARA